MYKALNTRCSILLFIIARVPPVWILMNFHTLLQELLTRHKSTVAEFLSKNYSWVGPYFAFVLNFYLYSIVSIDLRLSCNAFESANFSLRAYISMFYFSFESLVCLTSL